MWRRLDVAGYEIARLARRGDIRELSGTALFMYERLPCQCEYSIICDAAWLTRSVTVRGSVGGRSVHLHASVDPVGRRWRLNGVEAPAGCRVIQRTLWVSGRRGGNDQSDEEGRARRPSQGAQFRPQSSLRHNALGSVPAQMILSSVGLTATAVTRSSTRPASVHVSPPSSLRNTPPSSAPHQAALPGRDAAARQDGAARRPH